MNSSCVYGTWISLEGLCDDADPSKPCNGAFTFFQESCLVGFNQAGSIVGLSFTNAGQTCLNALNAFASTARGHRAH